MCALLVSFSPRRIRNDFGVNVMYLYNIIMNVCRTFKNTRENNRGGKLVMFSLKPCTTYLHNIIIHATDTINKNENVSLYNIENGKKSRASRSRHPQRFISCVSAAMVRRRWRLRRPFSSRSRLRYYRPFIITTHILL